MTQSRVVLVGIGGASCSGKTLLAKHLARILPGRPLLIHQDDFAPSSDKVPVHPVHGVQDWDDPPTCIEWPRMRDALAHVREHGRLPSEFASFDHLNKQTEIGVDEGAAKMWSERLKAAAKRVGGQGGEEKVGSSVGKAEGEEAIQWVLVDGFVLYWDKAVADSLDIKLMLRVPREKLKERREARAVYVLQNAEDAAKDGVWEDPPDYFDNIVYPAYVKAHAHAFEGNDVESGRPTAESGIVLIDPPEGEEGMTRALGEACTALLEAAEERAGRVVEA